MLEQEEDTIKIISYSPFRKISPYLEQTLILSHLALENMTTGGGGGGDPYKERNVNFTRMI